jgi:hypothetical protein
LLAILILISIALPGYASMSIYDLEDNLKYTIDDEGVIYNNQGKMRARIIENKVYDSILNLFWFRIEGHKIFNRKNELKYRVVGNRVVDAEGKPRYYIKGKPFAEIMSNSQSLYMQQ